MSLDAELYQRVRQLEQDMAEVRKRLNMSWSPAAYWSPPAPHGGVSAVPGGRIPTPPSGGSGVPFPNSYSEIEKD